jgi:uncharacterized membrane protein YecN with MAPEG domain
LTAPITTLIYAGILGLMLIVLSIRTSLRRRETRVSLGTGNDAELLRRSRIQGNFVEFVPLALLLIWMLDFAQFSVWLIHLLGILLIVARLLHAWALSYGEGWERFGARAAGILGTYIVIATGSILAICWALIGFRF